VERNNRFLAWLLLGLAIYFIISSMRQQQSQLELAEQKKQQELQILQTKRQEESKQLAAKIAEENPGLIVPTEPPRQRWTLGTMDPTDGYRFLVTLDNRGAMIERVELVEQQQPGHFNFRSLHTKNIGGYLGYLAPEERSGGGVIIHSVPGGSAAASAICQQEQLTGLQPGDVLVNWEGLDGPATLYQLNKTLNSMKPGDELRLEVERTAAPGAMKTFIAKLTEEPAAILRAEDDFVKEQVTGNTPKGMCGLTFSKIDGKEIFESERVIAGLEGTLDANWQASPLQVEGGMGIEFRLPLTERLALAGIDANLELVKQYRLKKGKVSDTKPVTADDYRYHMEMSTIVRNLDEKPHEIALRQEGLNGISLEGWWYPTKLSPHFFSAPGARDVIVGDKQKNYSISMTRALVDHAKKNPTDPDFSLFGPQDVQSKRDLAYIGLDTQVFTAAMLPAEGSPESMQDLQKAKAKVLNNKIQDASGFDRNRQQAYNTEFWFVTRSKTLAPNEEFAANYQIFAGPKSPELLAAYGMDEAIEYGWDIFRFFAVKLGWILHFFYYVVGNYGLAIVMLTVMVRSLMFPVSRRMAVNAQKMQSIQPEMSKLKEALKEEPTKMMAAQQLLLKKAGINQLAGCLPALIQLPIVIGLYRCVSVDVALRQQPLIPGIEWCSNLAGPDMMLDWHSWMPDFIAGRGSGWFGPYLNILPLITISLFIIQQKILMPKATDEQTRTAQQMMMIMTIFMGVLFFRVPAGLCIYFITSSTWSLIERFLIKKYTPKAEFEALPEGTVNEILAAVANTSPGQRPALPSANKADKTKLKNTKPPETFAELFEPFFKKKQVTGETGENSKGTKSGNRPPERARPPRPEQRKGKNKN
jgi:YidC/Oxa1 family membrane protein insertase